MTHKLWHSWKPTTVDEEYMKRRNCRGLSDKKESSTAIGKLDQVGTRTEVITVRGAEDSSDPMLRKGVRSGHSLHQEESEEYQWLP